VESVTFSVLTFSQVEHLKRTRTPYQKPIDIRLLSVSARSFLFHPENENYEHDNCQNPCHNPNESYVVHSSPSRKMRSLYSGLSKACGRNRGRNAADIVGGGRGKRVPSF
jgi:hypothetical protein